MSLTLDYLATAWANLKIEPDAPVLVHTSLSAFGRIEGGAETLVASLRRRFKRIMMPTFTYQTMVTPSSGPNDNGITYGQFEDNNLMATLWREDLPAHPLMGITAETFRQGADVRRSSHPIQSFAGLNVAEALASQERDLPLAPIAALSDLGGYVLLLGVDHTSNTSIHLGERLAGRATFTRWTLTADGVAECRGWPACSDGFEALAPYLGGVQKLRVGFATVQAVPIHKVVSTARYLIEKDPLALVCNNPTCERCASTRVLVGRIHAH
jgi:aminoglycoside 3-N-acetyltransferase